jgi:formylglycine-generating enzyme required for sulfatase activity
MKIAENIRLIFLFLVVSILLPSHEIDAKTIEEREEELHQQKVAAEAEQQRQIEDKLRQEQLEKEKVTKDQIAKQEAEAEKQRQVQAEKAKQDTVAKAKRQSKVKKLAEQELEAQQVAEAEKQQQQQQEQKAKSDAQPSNLSDTTRAIEPEMVAIPAGNFTMGCVANREYVGCYENEKPEHTVFVAAFLLAKTEVTFEQWDVCVAAGKCGNIDDQGWGRGKYPVYGVNWQETQGYIQWLNSQTEKTYRLPTEAEWEYAARAGNNLSADEYLPDIGHEYANYGNEKNHDGFIRGKDQWLYTSPVASFPANDYGLFDMTGNVTEWVEDCYHDSYKNAPGNQGAWNFDCGADLQRVLRSGSWNDPPYALRVAHRFNYSPDKHYSTVGFRLARTK